MPDEPLGTTAGIAVRCVGTEQRYEIDGETVLALDGVTVAISPGETVALFGPSGSGKSTLTALLAGLRRPTGGEVWVGEDDLATLPERALLRLRGETIGVVLQNPSRSLLPYATAAENITFARRGMTRDERRALPPPTELLSELGLGELAHHVAARMSGGEQQRLSVAVGMGTLPRLLLADEPTSQLDVPNRDRVVDLLLRIGERYGTTIIVVTHDPEVADRLGRRITLRSGQVVGDQRRGAWQ